MMPKPAGTVILVADRWGADRQTRPHWHAGTRKEVGRVRSIEPERDT
jgi:hypothetical protein